MIDHDNLGALTRVDWQLTPTQTLQPGFWVQSQEPPGPLSTQKKYKVTASGLVFDGWQMLSDNDSHRLLSPYLTYLGQFDALNVEAGLRYVNLRLGALTAYNATGKAAALTDADAARAAGGVDALASADAKTFNEWLPYLGLTWAFDPDNQRLHAPGAQLWAGRQSLPLLLRAEGVVREEGRELPIAVGLGWSWKPPTAWTSGCGTRARIGCRPDDLPCPAPEQAIDHLRPRIDARYPWNVADADRYGVELEGTLRITPAWSLVGNYTWNRFRYLEDLALSATGTIATEGKQVVDTPEQMLKLGARYEHDAWGLGLDARYIGERYGDVLNEERVDAVTLFDASAHYRLTAALNLTLSVLNVFDQEYIGAISAADDAIANYTAALNGVTGNGSTYQYGAPRTLYVGLSAQF